MSPSSPLWQPSETAAASANIVHYQTWLKSRHNLHFSTYSQLWQWSVDHPADFWESLWQYFDILHHTPYREVM